MLPSFKQLFKTLSPWILGYLAIGAVLRLVLILTGPFQLGAIPAFFLGFLNDSVLLLFLLPLILLALSPVRWLRSKCEKFGTVLFYAFTTLAIFVFLFIGVIEFFFWGEFESRFNFVAVDYLIYTSELFGNIRESFPVFPIVSAAIIFSLILAITVIKKFNMIDRLIPLCPKWKAKAIVVLSILPICLIGTVIYGPFEAALGNTYASISHNGIYEFARAVSQSSIDYERHYQRLPKEEVEALAPQTSCRDPEKRATKPNVMFVLMESFGKRFIGQGYTPYFEALANESLYFNNAFSSGTRTVRGIEATMLSLPPTPGQSIVKRPHNENLHSLGTVFKGLKYDTKFIYGGFGAFDNMNAFMSANGMEIVDRTSFDKETEITFANIWGVADGDLFNKALKEADKSFALKKPFFNYLLTTTNHRPFTYPEGKVSIKSGTSREGAILYTDYAVRDFIAKAKKHAWFDNTIFVFIADHSVGGRGDYVINPYNYEIPMMFYAPKLITPALITKPTAQIDAPVILEYLAGIKDCGHFFGKQMDEESPIYMGTNQVLGFKMKDTLVMLRPRKPIQTIDPSGKSSENSSPITEIEKLAVSYYQKAASFFKEGKLQYKGL